MPSVIEGDFGALVNLGFHSSDGTAGSRQLDEAKRSAIINIPREFFFHHFIISSLAGTCRCLHMVRRFHQKLLISNGTVRDRLPLGRNRT